MAASDSWFTRVTEPVKEAGAMALAGEAARRLADWLETAAISPAELAAMVDRGDTSWVLSALATIPTPEVGRARIAYGAIVAHLQPKHFWEILKHDALHEHCDRRANLHPPAVCYAAWLKTPDRWPRTVQAFQAAQRWLMSGVNGNGAPP